MFLRRIRMTAMELAGKYRYKNDESDLEDETYDRMQDFIIEIGQQIQAEFYRNESRSMKNDRRSGDEGKA